MNNILDKIIKFGPIALTAIIGILESKQNDKEKTEMINEITKGVLKGLKK